MRWVTPPAETSGLGPTLRRRAAGAGWPAERAAPQDLVSLALKLRVQGVNIKGRLEGPNKSQLCLKASQGGLSLPWPSTQYPRQLSLSFLLCLVRR
jgi:hypothetical protein